MPSRAARELRGFSDRALRGMLFLLPIAAGMTLSFPVFAQTTITNTAGAQSALCNILSWMFWILLAVSVIMIFWAGYLYATARDDAEQITRAKKTIFYAALGIAAALLAKGFPGFVASIFGQSVRACK
jgi:hypothetical protein